MTPYIFLSASITLGVVGQLGLKLAVSREPIFFVYNKMFNEALFAALCLYFVSVILYTISLRALPISLAYPCVALSYVFVSLASHYIWGTPFGLREVLAFLLIILGVSLIATGEHTNVPT